MLGSPTEKRRHGRGTPVLRLMLNLRENPNDMAACLLSDVCGRRSRAVATAYGGGGQVPSLRMRRQVMCAQEANQQPYKYETTKLGSGEKEQRREQARWFHRSETVKLISNPARHG